MCRNGVWLFIQISVYIVYNRVTHSWKASKRESLVPLTVVQMLWQPMWLRRITWPHSYIGLWCHVGGVSKHERLGNVALTALIWVNWKSVNHRPGSSLLIQIFLSVQSEHSDRSATAPKHCDFSRPWMRITMAFRYYSVSAVISTCVYCNVYSCSHVTYGAFHVLKWIATVH